MTKRRKIKPAKSRPNLSTFRLEITVKTKVQQNEKTTNSLFGGETSQIIVLSFFRSEITERRQIVK